MNPPDERRAECEELYSRYGRELWAIAYARRLDSEQAMDIVHEAFLRYWNQRAIELIRNPRAWLQRVTRNLIEDVAKSAFRKNGTAPPERMHELGDTSLQPLDRMVREEDFGRLRGILAELPEADRDVLTLRYALDYDTVAIGEMLGINPSAVYMRLSRARQKVEERLKAMGAGDEP